MPVGRADAEDRSHLLGHPRQQIRQLGHRTLQQPPHESETERPVQL
jgi:hypothetical protein